MLSIAIRFDNMNATSTGPIHEPVNSNGEFYLLLIVIKLSILIASKIIQASVHLYKLHNKKVIESHDRSTVARIKGLIPNNGDGERGLPNRIP